MGRALGGKQLADESDVLGTGEDRRWCKPVTRCPVSLDDSHRQGVEGEGGDDGEGPLDAAGDSGAQLGCATAGEREEEHLLRWSAPGDEMAGSAGQELRLAGSGAGDDELGAVGVGDGLIPA
jgi:hypothetical protein